MTHALSIALVTCQSVMQWQKKYLWFHFLLPIKLGPRLWPGHDLMEIFWTGGKSGKGSFSAPPLAEWAPSATFLISARSSFIHPAFSFFSHPPLVDITDNSVMYHYRIAKLLYSGQYFQMLRISWFLLWDPCHVCECPATRNVAGSRHTNVSCGPFPEMSKIATWQSWPSQKWYMSTWDRWFYLSLPFWKFWVF